MNTITCCLILFSIGIMDMIASDPINPLSDAFIDLINKAGKWTAGRNFHQDTPMEYIEGLLGVTNNSNDYKVPILRHDKKLIESLPESFDARDKWPNCPSLNEIRDQGKCGSCWAFAAVETMTDRVCIYSNGTQNVHFSAEDLVTCNAFEGGCDGNTIESAWLTWKYQGIVSGGNYNSHQGCKPYSIPTCKHHATMCTQYIATPPCVQACENGYNKTYNEDKHYGKTIYQIEGEGDIMAELYINGSVTASYLVYEDFVHYKSGVYQHVEGKLKGAHAVKIIGWGVENGLKFWLVANSWNTDFGEKGYFKILRGQDECGIESITLYAGEPSLEHD